MDNQQLLDNEYYIKKKFYILYSLSIIISFLGGFYLKDYSCSNIINIHNDTFDR